MPPLGKIKLGELQAAFMAAIQNHDDGAALASPGRINVYRANYVGNLTNALRLTYPAIERLVGPEFFDDMAAVFVDGTPPHTGNLNDYGAGFGDFLSGFEPVAHLAYLGGVARLEWALFHAAVAPDAAAMDPAALAGLAQLPESAIRFALHPALGLVRDDFPVDAIRAAVLSGDDAAIAGLDMKSGPVFLLVARAGDDVTVRRVSKGEWDLLAALGAGDDLARALEESSDLDAGSVLAGHLAAGDLISR